MRLRSPGCEIFGTCGNAQWDPGLSQQDKSHRGAPEAALPKAFSNANFIAAQAKDPDCLRYMQLVNKPRRSGRPTWLQLPFSSCTSRGGCACKLTISSARNAVLPAFRADFRQRTVHAHHLSYYGGHFGLAKTFARLTLRYWWPRQCADVRAFLARRTFCMANNFRSHGAGSAFRSARLSRS